MVFPVAIQAQNKNPQTGTERQQEPQNKTTWMVSRVWGSPIPNWEVTPKPKTDTCLLQSKGKWKISQLTGFRKLSHV